MSVWWDCGALGGALISIWVNLGWLVVISVFYWTRPHMRMVVNGGGWWCVEDGGGVCGKSPQACVHAASVEMDNLTPTRRSSTVTSTYETCAHVPPIVCIPRLPTGTPGPMDGPCP